MLTAWLFVFDISDRQLSKRELWTLWNISDIEMLSVSDGIVYCNYTTFLYRQIWTEKITKPIAIFRCWSFTKMLVSSIDNHQA